MKKEAVSCSPEHLQMIAELRALQGATPDAEFCKRYNLFSATKWYRIKTLDEKTGLPLYASMVDDFNATLLKLERDLIRIRAQKAFERDVGGVDFFEFDSFTMVRNAVLRCADEPKKRIVVFLARTNGGKTVCMNQMVMALKARVIVAAEPWRFSYKAALLDLLNGLGLMPSEFLRRKKQKLNPRRRTEGELEEALLAGMNRMGRGILAIDEAHVFGARSINLVKHIINKTDWRIVLGAQPVLYERWVRKNQTEAEQIISRCALIHEADPVKPADVLRFLPGVALNGASEEAARMIAEAANRFGLYGFVKDVSQRLRGLHSGRHVSIADVSEAIATEANYVRRLPGNKERQ